MAETGNYFLGIEYSKERVKCALLKKVGIRYEVGALEIFQGEASNTLDLLTQWKKKILPEEVVRATVSISESSIFLKEFNVPNAKRESLDEAIYWELSSVSPLPAAQAIFEWAPLTGTKDSLNVVAMAVRSAMIESITQKLEDSGIEVSAIEPASVSLARVAGADYSKNTMLLMVGDQETDIVVMKSGKPVFSTTSDVPLKRAKEKWRLSDPVSEAIAKNTKELISFWEEKNKDKIQQVLITGDLVDKYFGLAANINEFAKIPVNISKQKSLPGVTFVNLPKSTVNRFFVAIGASLRFLGDEYSDINLIPKDKRQKIKLEIAERQKLYRLKTLNITAGYILFSFMIVAVFFVSMGMSYSSAIEKTQEEVDSHPGQAQKSYVEKTNRYLNEINRLVRSPDNLGFSLRVISSLTPQELKITKMDYVGMDKHLSIEGEGAREAILAYQQKLQSDLGAKTVTMKYPSLNSDTNGKFQIDIIW